MTPVTPDAIDSFGQLIVEPRRYTEVNLGAGVNGRGQKVFVLQAKEHTPSGRTYQISLRFDTYNEARNWLEHAMPGAVCDDPYKAAA